MLLLDPSAAPAVPHWLGFSVIAAAVAGLFSVAVSLIGAGRAGKNGRELALLNSSMAKTSLDEARAYSERLARVNPYIELLQTSMTQCIDVGVNLGILRGSLFTPGLRDLLLRSSVTAIGWDMTNISLSRLRFNIALTLHSRDEQVSFLRQSAQLSRCHREILDEALSSNAASFDKGRDEYLAIAVKIFDLLRISARQRDVAVQKDAMAQLVPTEIVKLILDGALSEVRLKIAPTNFFWVVWWGFNDLTGPGEDDTDLHQFLLVFNEVETALRTLPSYLEVKSERILNVERTKLKEGVKIAYHEHYLALHVRFPSQVALDGFAPILDSIKVQSRLIWSTFAPEEARSS